MVEEHLHVLLKEPRSHQWKRKSRKNHLSKEAGETNKEMEVKEEKWDLQAVNKEMIVWRMNGPAEALLITH